MCRYSISNQVFFIAGFLFLPILPEKSFLTHNFADTAIPSPSLLSKDVLCPTNGLFDGFEEAVFSKLPRFLENQLAQNHLKPTTFLFSHGSLAVDRDHGISRPIF